LVTKVEALTTNRNEGLVPLDAAVHGALSVAQGSSERVFVVGGVVRDLLMKRLVGDHDLDLVVEGDGPSFAHALSRVLGGSMKVHQPFLTAKLSSPFMQLPGQLALLDEVDIATARTEVYERPGALPVVAPASIERDLFRRDFSINSMALPLAAYAQHLQCTLTTEQAVLHLVDPCGGYQDLMSRSVRILHPLSFIDDPTRLFRALRYCVRLSFELARETEEAFQKAVQSGVLTTISPRRVWNEVLACFDEGSPQETIGAFVRRGLFSELELVSEQSLSRLTQGFERIGEFQRSVSAEVFVDAAKRLVVAVLPEDRRAVIVKAVQEAKSLLTQAHEAAKGESNKPSNLATCLAAYGVYGSRPLRDAIEDAVRGD
jgi:tRNA nucleotidyltransferase/poly(A) polymerase